MSQEIIMKIIAGKYPALPNIFLPVVDVRDVAQAHLNSIVLSPPSGKYILVESKCFLIILSPNFKYLNLNE